MAPSLAYHVKLLDVLAGTAVGRLNITTVEAKLQNLYKPKDLLVALLDSSVTLDVLVPLANFFYHAVIEVEIVVPDLCKSPDLWNYLDVCVSHFGEAKKQLERMQEQQVEKGHDATLTRKLLQFAFLSVANVQGFFTFYFNEAEMSAFTFNPLTSAQGASADVGADVGGFFGNPSTKLLVRWYQMAMASKTSYSSAHTSSSREQTACRTEGSSVPKASSCSTTAMKSSLRVLLMRLINTWVTTLSVAI